MDKNMTASDLAVGAYTAKAIADLVTRAIRPNACPHQDGRFIHRTRSETHRRAAAYHRGVEEFSHASVCDRGLDPYCPYSDPESEQFRTAIEAARYVRILRHQYRSLKTAALAVCADPAELLIGPVSVDYPACRRIARQALDEIGHSRAVYAYLD